LVLSYSRDVRFSKKIAPICLPTGDTALEENRYQRNRDRYIGRETERKR
jgi:hypothetical protein